jgi:hypothetical protein
MSSPGSAPLTLDLPRLLLADRITVLLIAACVIVVEAVLLRQPDGLHGAGVLAGVALAGWHWSRLRAGRRPERAILAPDGGWQLVYPGGRVVPARLVRGSRLLGRSAALKWRVEGRLLALWFTPADLPRATLRGLRVRLSGAGQRTGM